MPVIDGDDRDFRSVLASVDRRGRRKAIHLLLVDGIWRRRRTALAVVLIAVLLGSPFLTVDGLPFLRIDIPGKRMVVAGAIIHAMDLPVLLPAAILLILGTALMVATVGRFFCGWLCPHSVLLEHVFRRIELWTRGAPARRRAGGPGARTRLIAAWIGYAIAAGAIANALTAVFVGTQAFRFGVLIDPIGHPSGAIFWSVAFALMLANFGWFREQTCTIVCPYGRLQTVMLDPHSQAVAYDPRRGEPRGRGADRAGKGDCVDCGLCVQVCPTAIDIRNGNQMECLHCTACIDACDGVMARVGKPPGLIRYASEVALAGGRSRWLRPRTVIYATLMAAVLGGWAVLLAGREPAHLTVQRTTARPLRVADAEGEWIRQSVTISMTSSRPYPLTATMALADLPTARLAVQGASIAVPVGGHATAMVLIDAPAAAFAGSSRRSRIVARWTAPDGAVREAGTRLILHAP